MPAGSRMSPGARGPSPSASGSSPPHRSSPPSPRARSRSSRRELGRALGINGMVIGAGLILGPILGGWLTQFGWRTVFWFNVPIGLVGTAAAATLLVEQGRRAPRAGLDLAGSALYLVGLTGLVTAL